MADEWGPWIEHDDGGVPAGVYPTTIVMVDFGDAIVGPIAAGDGDWHCPHDPVLRYRIRKPKGLTILEEIIADIPAPTKPKVDA